jgi:hypothetical protein
MINTEFLNEVANFVNSKVAKVVINGTYEITNFEVKAVTDNILALKYLVPVSDVTLITEIELKDAQDNNISSNSVYVPITTDHVMIQAIEVREGV